MNYCGQGIIVLCLDTSSSPKRQRRAPSWGKESYCVRENSSLKGALCKILHVHNFCLKCSKNELTLSTESAGTTVSMYCVAGISTEVWSLKQNQKGTNVS